MRSRPTAESPATTTTSSEGVRIGPSGVYGRPSEVDTPPLAITGIAVGKDADTLAVWGPNRTPRGRQDTYRSLRAERIHLVAKFWQLDLNVRFPVPHWDDGMTISVSEPKRLDEVWFAESPEYTARHS
jgi:hypothetical protein